MLVRVLVGALVFAAAARAQETDAQLEEILRRLEASEARNEELAGEVEKLKGENLNAQVEEYLAQQRTASDTGTLSKKGVRWQFYGFVRLDTYYNTGRMNSVIVPSTVAAEGAQASSNDDQFAFDVRLTRLGFTWDFGQIGDWAASALVETDFSNFPAGVAESRETPRIRLAYIQLDGAKWRIRLGQDWDVISPLYPSANNQGVMWNAGNLGDRRPQAQFHWKGSGSFSATFALGLTGAVDNRDLDAGMATPIVNERDGFDSGLPNLQVRGAYAFERGSGRKGAVGAWVLIATHETDNTFAGEDEFMSWAVGVDASFPIGDKLLVKGEIWMGEALSDFRGNIGQFINTTTGEEIAGWGGWVEFEYQHSDKWAFYAGSTVDNPDDGDVGASGGELNVTLYVGARRMWSKNLRSAFDVTYWETQYDTIGLGNMVRFNLWTSIDF